MSNKLHPAIRAIRFTPGRPVDVHVSKDVDGPATVLAFTFVNDAALEWARESVGEDAQWLGTSTLVVEHRYAGHLADGLREAGFKVA